MNSFDYFFENSSPLEKPFLLGKEETSFNELHHESLKLATWLRNEFGQDKHILLLSVNNRFFLVSYLAILKSGNICIPLDPAIEQENFTNIAGLTEPSLIFLTKDIRRKLPLDNYRCMDQ